VLLKPKNQQVQQNGSASNTKAARIIIALVVVGFRGLLLFCLHVCYATHVLVCFHWGGQRSGEWQPVAKSQKCVAKIKCDATEKPSYRASELGGFQWLLR